MKRKLLWVGTIVVAIVLGALISNIYPVLAQNYALGGGWRFTTTTAGGPVDFVVLPTTQGGVLGSVAPLSCLSPGTSISMAVGTWGLGSVNGGFGVHLQMVGPIYSNGQNIGDLTIVANFPIPTSNQISGHATIGIPQAAGCSAFSGPATFSGTQIPAVPVETAN